jgi:hypothetical protein
VITTPDLIAALAADAKPVRRLRPPLVRAGAWLSFAMMLLTLLAIVHGVRPDLAEHLRRPIFVAGALAALVTGVLAAVSSFLVSLPDRSRLWLLLPAPSLAVWVSTIGYGCLTGWVGIAPDGIQFGEAFRCFVTLIVTSVPLSFAMLVMLRYAAILRPILVTISGSLSVAAITATALSIFHDLDASVMILIWNVGISALIVALGGTVGPRLLGWLSPRWIPTKTRRISRPP